jgi:maleylpyruvate isomerase
MILYDYGLSSASYRVRIALALKNLPYTSISKNLRAGEHRLSEYLSINVQGFVPALGLDDGAVLIQSLAIIEYLDEIYPTPRLLPAEPLARARVRALAQVITSDIHPLNNSRVLRYLEDKLSLDREARDLWYRHWVGAGFDALERWLVRDAAAGAAGRFCHGNAPTLADICLVPQVFNARRFAVDMNPYPRILAIDAACRELPEFQTAAPK